MNDEENKDTFYKRYEKEPRYIHALIVCYKHRGEILTNVGVNIRAFNSGLIIQYKRKDGRKLTALVHNREQYIIELYRINLIAESEYPELIRNEDENLSNGGKY